MKSSPRVEFETLSLIRYRGEEVNADVGFDGTRLYVLVRSVEVISIPLSAFHSLWLMFEDERRGRLLSEARWDEKR